MRQVSISGESGAVSTQAEDVSAGLDAIGAGRIAKGRGVMDIGNALGDVGSALNDVGDAMDNVSRKANQALTKNQVASVQTDMQRQFNATNTANASSLNTQEVFDRTKGTYDYFQQMLENADEVETAPLTTEARNHLKKALEGFKTQSVSNYNVSRAKAEAEVALSISQDLITDAIADADVNILAGAVELGVSTGLYTESQGDYIVGEGTLDISTNQAGDALDSYQLAPYTAGMGIGDSSEQLSIEEMTNELDSVIESATSSGVRGSRMDRLLAKRDVAVERINKQTSARATDILSLKKQGRIAEAVEKVKSMPDGRLKTNLENDLKHTRPSNYLSSIGSQIAYAQNLTQLQEIEDSLLPELTPIEQETLRRRFIAKRATLRGGVGKKDSEKIFRAVETGKLNKESIQNLGLTEGSLKIAEALVDRVDLLAEMELYETRSIVDYEAVRPYLAPNSTVRFNFIDEQESVEYVKDKLGEAERSKDTLKIKLSRDFEAYNDDKENKVTKGPNVLKGKYAAGYLEAHILSLKAGPVKDNLLTRLELLLSNDGTHLYTSDSVIKSVEDLNIINAANSALEDYATVSASMSPSEKRRDRNSIYDLIVGVAGGAVEKEQAEKDIEAIRSRASHLQALDAIRYSFDTTKAPSSVYGAPIGTQTVPAQQDLGSLF